MAEVLGLVISIVELAGSIISTGKKLYKLFEDGPKELRAILLETASLKAQLEFVDLFSSSSAVATQENEIKLQVEHAQQILDKVHQLLSRFMPEQPGKGRRAAARVRDSVLQLLKRPEINERVEELRNCRNALNQTPTTDTCMAVRHIASNVCQIKDILGDGERHRFLKELIIVDPSGNHHEACHLHDSTTSAWVTRTEEWKAWIEGSLRLWWIDGIPGAGKTILASHLIDGVKSLAEQQSDGIGPTIGWSYYYCHHARSPNSEDGSSQPYHDRLAMCLKSSP